MCNLSEHIECGGELTEQFGAKNDEIELCLTELCPDYQSRSTKEPGKGVKSEGKKNREGRTIACET